MKNQLIFWVLKKINKEMTKTIAFKKTSQYEEKDSPNIKKS